MDAQIFWKVIGAYNMDTWGLQIVLLLVLLVMFALSYTQKAPWAAKFALGIANLWIGHAVVDGGMEQMELPLLRQRPEQRNAAPL